MARTDQFTPNGVGFWVVSRYDDVVAVFKDPETFSVGTGRDPKSTTAKAWATS